MFPRWLKNLFGRPRRRTRKMRPRGGVKLRSSYDAAGVNDQNRRHWKNADSLSARAAGDPDTRSTLRIRSRYELVENDGYGKGAVESLANDTVGGNGPRLQVLHDNETAARQIEVAFTDWAWACGLAEKLRLGRKDKTVSGEAFWMLISNPLLNHSVKLDLRDIEADQVATPYWAADGNEQADDGIVFDQYGNPVEYHVLKSHPGDSLNWVLDYDRVPARFMLHWFRKDRSGQRRGMPEFATALPFFAFLRRFTLATLTGAEIAAAIAALIESQGPVDIDATDDKDDWTSIDVVHGMMTKLPAGWRMNQMDAKHPATTFEMFETRILMRIARCVCMPLNVISGNSAKYNFSSARLDNNNYRSAIRVDRAHCERVVLDRIFLAWMDEAIDVPGLLPAGFTSANVRWTWTWPGWDYIDPLKERQATTEGLTNGTLTLAEAEAEAGTGTDWREKVRQRGLEKKACEEAGVSPPGGAAKPAQKPKPDEEEDEVEEEMNNAA